MSENKYPIGGYAPGSYHCRCATCGGGFVGDKRSYQCEPCALYDKAKFDALSPSEQEALVKKNAAAIREAFKDWGKKPDLNPAIIGHGPEWIKASTRLPLHKAFWNMPGDCNNNECFFPVRIDGNKYRVGEIFDERKEGASEPVYMFVINGEDFYEKDFHRIEWLDESESPAEQPVYTEQERHETRLALRLILKLFRNDQISKQQEKHCAEAEAILKKYSKGKIILKEKPSPWISADTKPEHNVGVLVFIPGEDNHITSGMWDVSNEWVLLDEYRTPEEDVTHWMPLPAFPEGYTWNEIPDDLVDTIKKVAKEELAKRPKSPEPPVMEVEHDFIEFIQNERNAISKEMLSDTWWLEIPAAKRVVFENILIAYDQMVEIFKKEK